MTLFRVLERGIERPARAVHSAAAQRFLHLFGVDSEPGPSSEATHLGDLLLVCARALELTPGMTTLAAARVVEADGASHRVGDVIDNGETDGVASWASHFPDGVAIVADDGRSPTESIAEDLRERLLGRSAAQVCGVLNLGEALDLVLGLGPRARGGNLIPASRRVSAREALFDAVLQTRVVHPWSLVADLAVGLARHLGPEDVQAQFELDMVRDVARRHCGHTSVVAWASDELLRMYDLPRQLSIVAHIVQSVADGAHDAVAECEQRAQRVLGGDPRSPEALGVRGAIGRALAAAGNLDRARQVLSEAVNDWLGTDPVQASHALCELLRVEGIRGELDAVGRLQTGEVAAVLGAGADATSRGYLQLALARALVQAGASAEALSILENHEVWTHAATHVRTAVHRWRAIAARTVGDDATVENALVQLDALDVSAQRHLARLDAEDLDLAGTASCLEELVALPGEGDEARRLLDRLAPGLSLRAIAERPEVLRRVRAEYRY